jgi:hypothetical protein
MIIPDACLLLYAYDSESPVHEIGHYWRFEEFNGTTPIVLTHLAVFALLAISTTLRVFRNPLS